MNEKETAALVEAMQLAQRNYCADGIGGLRNPNFAAEAMQAALAVAQKAIRNDVLEEVAKALAVQYSEWMHGEPSPAMTIRAMKELPNE